MTDIVTGDKTYADRVERYEYIMKRLDEKPKPTYDKLAKELGITRQRVHAIVRKGTVRPSGRPTSNAARQQALTARLLRWQERRAAKLVAGKPTGIEDRWVEDIEERLKALA